jgi:hypothetical protein
MAISLGPVNSNTIKPLFLNVYGAQKSIPRNEFRQPMKPGPVFVDVYGFQESIPNEKLILTWTWDMSTSISTYFLIDSGNRFFTP